jgi:hypothetical protein
MILKGKATLTIKSVACILPMAKGQKPTASSCNRFNFSYLRDTLPMKKVISYLLALLLLLNVLGYYGLFLGLKYQHAESFTQRLDEERYRHSEIVTLKVPVAIPYLQNTDFERVNGEFEYKGEFFRLVKQRFASDTLYVVCIKDIRSKHIKQALAEYVKTFSDHPVTSTSDTLPSFIKDYISHTFSIGHTTDGWCYTFLFPTNEALTHFLSLSVLSPPPKA